MWYRNETFVVVVGTKVNALLMKILVIIDVLGRLVQGKEE